MSLFGENLGRGVSKTTANGSENFVVVFHVRCNAEVDQDNIGVFGFGSVEDVFGFDVAMDDVMMMKVLDGGEDGTDGSAGIEFGKSPAFEDAFEKFSAGSFFKDQIVLQSYRGQEEGREGSDSASQR